MRLLSKYLPLGINIPTFPVCVPSTLCRFPRRTTSGNTCNYETDKKTDDYPPGYPGENANFQSDRRLSHFNRLPVTGEGKEVEAIQRSRNMKRKVTAVDEDITQLQEPLKKRTKIPAATKKVVPRGKRAIADTDVGNLRRSGRHYKSPIDHGA